ncbi:Chorismate synthase [Nymphon striatum]|nr:Chorismate synthase [Nymphon striatum]
MAHEKNQDVLISTGTPISMMIRNTDQRSKDYGDIKDRYRPGHADYTYDLKIRHSRLSWRWTFICQRNMQLVLLQADWRARLLPGMLVRGAMVQMGTMKINRDNWDWDATDLSVGAVIEVVAEGVPAGIGAPVYAKLDQDIASHLMSINAVKGVEIGNGFEAAEITGLENADEMRMSHNGDVQFLSNNAGGVLGGIATGQPVVARFAVKPTSSMLTKTKSVTAKGEEVDVMTKGRHDPCVGIRAVPIGEAMVACAIADHYLLHRGQTGRI